MRLSRVGLGTLLVVVAFGTAGSPVQAQACRGEQDPGLLESCLEGQVETLRREIEQNFDLYMELLPTPSARQARVGQDEWERYVERECRDAGEQYLGGRLVLVEILACEEWGARQRALQLRFLVAALRGGAFVYDPTCFVPTSDVVALSGWISDRLYAGTTGGSEAFDGGQPVVVVNLDTPLCTDVGGGPEQVTAVQLVGVPIGLGRRARRLLGVPVRIEGRLFLPHTPAHRTPLVMLVHRLDPVGD